jgi:hypothetical protein
MIQRQGVSVSQVRSNPNTPAASQSFGAGTSSAASPGPSDSSVDSGSLQSSLRERLANLPDLSKIILTLLVLIASGGLYAMHWRTKSLASSLQATTASAKPADSPVKAFATTLISTRALIAQVQADSTRLTSGPTITADPFHYTRQRPVEVPVPQVAPSARADDNELRKALASLSLQSILAGRTSYCLINNQLYAVGQTVGPFTIESISPAAVVLRAGESRFELTMTLTVR